MGSNFQNNAPRVAKTLLEQARRAMKAATIFVKGKVVELLSVPAPHVLVKPKFGAPYYRATTPATPGAPPRKLSGTLRRSIAWELGKGGLVGRIGTNVAYARRLERQNHPYLTLAVQKYQGEIRSILGRAFQTRSNL